MSIRILKSTEQFSPSVKVNGRKVTAQWSVKKDRDEKSPRYVLSSTFDFSACSQDEIIALAMKSVVIEVQRAWRDMANTKGSTATTVNPFATVNVKTAIVDATRRSANPVSAAKAKLAKLTPAERKEVLAMFAKSVAAGSTPEKKTA